MGAADEAIDRLYELPLDEFTPARNELARRLRADGERDAAAKVAKLRKPSRPAWAINRVARKRPELAQALLEAAEGLADAQVAVVSGSGREALDDAAHAERRAVEEFVDAIKTELEAAGSASPAMIDRARKTLHAVPGDAELQAELDAARVVSDREPVGFGVAPVAPVKPRRGEPAAKAEVREAKDSSAAEERTAASEQAKVSRERLTEARRRVDRAKRHLAKREGDHLRATDRLEQAHQAVAAAEDEVAELAEDLQRRRKELEDAEAVLAELT